jgi:UDPglucose 6-dehydrogenase
MEERISIVGLGKLGLCLAACYAERGFETIGVDIEERIVNSINNGTAPWFEPELSELLQKHGGKRLLATLSHNEAIEKTDITIILVATPSNPDGSFSNRFIESALKSLATAYGQSKKKYHTFVISSTVMPGSINSSFIPIIEKYSGRKVNTDFGLCYDPDFVALGNVIKGFLQPDVVIIGESNPDVGARIETVHRALCENQPALKRMSIISAEIAKVSLNAYITLKISFANSIANLCEKVPSADVDAITTAIGADRRISPYYFKGGLSFGGTCFPRDTHAFITFSEKQGIPADLIRAVEQINNFQNLHLIEIVKTEIQNLENRTIGVIGLGFTSNTPVIIESPALKLIDALEDLDIRIIVFDSFALDNTRAVYGSKLQYTDSVIQCLQEAGLVVITQQNNKIKSILESYKPTSQLYIVDCWRILDTSKLNENIVYVPLGRIRD